MKHFALIGYPVAHSYSKQWFDSQHFADADYRLFPLPSVAEVRQWAAEQAIDGFNVTAPHKQSIIPLLDDLAPEARTIGAVNCVVVDSHHRLVGHNTDGPAFLKSLSSFLAKQPSSSHQALILGTGGAARAVAWALGQLQIPFRYVSRHPEKTKNRESNTETIGYDQLTHLHPLPTLLINATPLGTAPAADSTPLSALNLSLLHPLFVYDLVYNPSPSRLLREAAALGAITKDGLEMLHLQARLSWQLWGLE